VETPEDVWQKAGIDKMEQEEAIAYLEKLFAEDLEGAKLMSNAAHLRGSANWIKFPRVICENWVQWNDIDGKKVPVILMGDAAHTAHFSIGSGTKLAMEDAIDLARSFKDIATTGIDAVLDSYQANRSVEVIKIQNAARNAMEWFEEVERYTHLPEEQFNFSLLTRSQRISHENLRLRDGKYISEFDKWFTAKAFADAGVAAPAAGTEVPPMFTPLKVRDVLLKNRVVVSPMAQYSAVDGLAADYHLVHLGARAMGGAAMVFTEMTCVSADARITPGCPGLYKPEHTEGWKRIVDFVHQNTDAKIAVQIGHAGAKGATKLAWEGIDKPVDSDGWQLISASPNQYLAGVSQTSREMTREDMDRVKADFVRSTIEADKAGFDWLELHAAHGYLLSSFISPITNQRTDEYGGSFENRIRFPLELFAAVRAAYKGVLGIRISASDWVEGGWTPEETASFAKQLKPLGCDFVHISSGGISPLQKIAIGPKYQVPFAKIVKEQSGLPTMTVGLITDPHQAEEILQDGDADLIALARAFLYKPRWAWEAAAALGATVTANERYWRCLPREAQAVFGAVKVGQR
jgi:anthraniloyl-CoA monooxygenase